MAQNKQTLKDTPINDRFLGFLLVKSAVFNVTKHGSGYLNVTLSDKTGSITAMMWNVEPDDQVNDVMVTGNVVHVNGIVTDYQGSRQINLHNYRQKSDHDTVELSELVKSAPLDTAAALATIKAIVKTIDDPIIRDITAEILDGNTDAFLTHPAAKNVHHAYHGGLIYHTYSMLMLGTTISRLYKDLNTDLLYAGIILHDIGKIQEYSGVIGTETTLTGKLKGHISIISETIRDTANHLMIDPDNEAVVLLQHMVLSHHGRAEQGWGSPVSPQIIEAHVLHQIDMMDANIEAYRNAADETKPGEFTNRVFGLDNRAFYKHEL